MNIPFNVRMLARAASRAREDYFAGRISFDEYDDISTEFSDALEAWKDGVCPVSVADLDPEPPQPGDIYEDADGLSIVTPHGQWRVSDEQAVALLRGLTTMLHERLTRPWSAADPSTVLTRGTRHPQED